MHNHSLENCQYYMQSKIALKNHTAILEHRHAAYFEEKHTYSAFPHKLADNCDKFLFPVICRNLLLY